MPTGNEDEKVFDRELELLKQMSPSQLKTQVQLELGMMDVPAPTSLNYYPSQKYIDKNLKGESVHIDDLTALATAQRKAEQTGVLSPEVAKYFLANSLVEGRFSKPGSQDNNFEVTPADYGVNGNIFHGGNPAVKKVITALGLEDSTKPPQLSEELRKKLAAHGGAGLTSSIYKSTDVVIRPGNTSAINATLAAAILGIKSANAASPEDAIKAWNGVGPATDVHLAKVKEAHRMLRDPKNAAILRAYQKALRSE